MYFQNSLRFSAATVIVLLVTMAGGAYIWYSSGNSLNSATSPNSFTAAQQGEHQREESKKVRSEYFFRMLRDPQTNQIPANIRTGELEHAREMPRQQPGKRRSLFGSQSIGNVEWQEIGPKNVGGRTRALGVDVDDPNTIIAGGVSGGIWKSTNGGVSWSFKSTTANRLSTSWLIQDTTSLNNDTWYFATGEYDGSAGQVGAAFRGYGIFQSTDNGETWSRLPATSLGDDTSFNSQYDYISRLVINPVTGSLFMTSNAGGIYKYDGSNFSLVHGGLGDHIYTDLTGNKKGILLATLSENTFGTPTNDPGLYVSADDGDSWTNITPNTFPDVHSRSFAAFAPSAPDTAYVVTYLGIDATASDNDSVAFHMIEFNDGDTVLTEDRSANLPTFSPPAGEIAQSNYNMILSVKPDDPDFVLLGFTNLYRSRDGFKTPADNKSDNWIGGYATTNNNFNYANHHADQHALAFDPVNPDKLWSGHDGGLSLTNDITVSGPVSWQDMNNGYNVTQFYDVSIPDEAGDQRVMGGTQDNGTPIFFTNADMASQGDASTGDGGYSYFGDNYIYVSNQNGRIRRYSYTENGLGGFYSGLYTNFAFTYPSSASGALFINPFTIDPNDETVMYYPAGDDLWRNTDLEDTNTDMDGHIDDWEQLANLSPPAGSNISAISVSRANPAHRLYYSAFRDGNTPLIYKIDNANSAADNTSNLVDISVPTSASGAYVASIAVNPNDADELIAVMSNYNIVGLYHSQDAGATWSDIEGNLEGSADQNPSLRDAAILNTDTGKLYVVATSTGVYSTTAVNGSSTNWAKEGSNKIGNVVSTSLAHRSSDNTLLVGTHGRGIFGKIPKQQEVAGDVGWRMMSAPIESMPISEITDETPIQGFGDGFGKSFFTGWDGSSWIFPADLSGNLTSGKGFILYFFDNNQGGSSPLPVPISAEGSEPSGDVSVPLHADGDRYNLAGNPYNAPINFKLVTLDEVEAKFWVWDDATNQYYTYNGVTGVSQSGNDGHIAPWQGFMVRAESGAASPSLTFQQDDKAHFNAQFFRQEADKTTVKTLRLTVTGQDQIDNNTVAVFYEQGSTGYDAGDVEELQPLATDYISLSFISRNGEGQPVHLANDARQLNFREPQIFPMNLDVTSAGTYSIQWDLDEIPSDWITELYDRDTQRVVNLRTVERYEFEAGPAAQAKARADGQPGFRLQSTREPRFELTVRKSGFDQQSEIPGEFSLSQNYPNPFNPTTIIRYELKENANVRLDIFNNIGQRVATLINAEKAAGFYKAEFDASRLASGIYFYRLHANNFVETKPMTVIK